MSIKDQQGNWIDGMGKAVPPKYIDPVEKKRDAMVERLLKQAHDAQYKLATFKAMVTAEIGKYLDWLASTAGEQALNAGGNYTLTGFSGTMRVVLKVNKTLEFDERLQLAKQKIDRCIERWSNGANDNLRVIIFDAFKGDRKGMVDTKRILSLRKLVIKDVEWLEAMELITRAVMFSSSKEYLFFQERKQGGDWQTVRLDLAGV